MAPCWAREDEALMAESTVRECGVFVAEECPSMQVLVEVARLKKGDSPAVHW